MVSMIASAPFPCCRVGLPARPPGPEPTAQRAPLLPLPCVKLPPPRSRSIKTNIDDAIPELGVWWMSQLRMTMWCTGPQV